MILRALGGLGRFAYEFVVGDEWRIAAGVVVTIALAGLAVRERLLASAWLALLVAAAPIAIAGTAVLLEARRRAKG